MPRKSCGATGPPPLTRRPIVISLTLEQVFTTCVSLTVDLWLQRVLHQHQIHGSMALGSTHGMTNTFQEQWFLPLPAGYVLRLLGRFHGQHAAYSLSIMQCCIGPSYASYVRHIRETSHLKRSGHITSLHPGPTCMQRLRGR